MSDFDGNGTVRVRFEPSGAEIEVPDGTTLYAAARAAGLPVGSACRAEGWCGRCGLEVLVGEASLSPASDAERQVKARNRVHPALRLSCVATVHGPVTARARYW